MSRSRKQIVKYETTDVPADKSIAEITRLIREYGGSRMEQLWGEDGRVLGIRFAVRHPRVGELPVSLMLKTGEIERILAAESTRVSASKRKEQAERIAWRHEKDLIEQLLLSVKLGTRSLQGAFMAEIEAWDEAAGETVTLEELFVRRAELSSTGRGIELTAAREPSGAIELPPARESR